MPFPLPDGGPPYSEDLRWFLVAVPDDPAFVRAALGAYTEFTKYWVWGKEGKEPGRNEAAQVWENAVAATLEALEMGFPDILLGYIDQVEQLLQELIDKPCCADAPPNVVNQPTPSMEPTDIQDGVGSPPPTYGADPVADWSDWDRRKCGMAEVLKVLPANLLEELLTILEQENQPGWIEYIGDLMGKIPGVGEVAKLIWDTFTQLLSWGINQFTGAEEAIALIRAGEDDIKCAIYSADGEEAAAEAMKQATIDALGEYGHATIRIGLNYFPWELWAHVLYTGQFEDVDGNLVNVPYVPATDCCVLPPATSAAGLMVTALEKSGTDANEVPFRCGVGGDDEVSGEVSTDYILDISMFTTLPSVPYSLAAANTQAQLDEITADSEFLAARPATTDTLAVLGAYNYAATATLNFGTRIRVDLIFDVDLGTWRPVSSIEVVTILGTGSPTVVNGNELVCPAVDVPPKSWNGAIVRITG